MAYYQSFVSSVGSTPRIERRMGCGAKLHFADGGYFDQIYQGE